LAAFFTGLAAFFAGFFLVAILIYLEHFLAPLCGSSHLISLVGRKRAILVSARYQHPRPESDLHRTLWFLRREAAGRALPGCLVLRERLLDISPAPATVRGTMCTRRSAASWWRSNSPGLQGYPRGSIEPLISPRSTRISAPRIPKIPAIRLDGIVPLPCRTYSTKVLSQNNRLQKTGFSVNMTLTR
jgi:hypothetical protein